MGKLFSKQKYKAKSVKSVKSVVKESFPLSDGKLYMALYDYTPTTPDELEFNANDMLLVHVIPSQMWWLAQHQQTLKVGYIPPNFITEFNNSPNLIPGWHDITRFEAEQKLSMKFNSVGTYIIRPCSDKRHLVLSVRCLTDTRELVVNHNKITVNPNEYFIDKKRKFSSLKDLINHYHRTSGDGLISRLNHPLQIQKHLSIQFRDIEIDRRAIKFIKKIGTGNFGEVFKAQLNDTKVAVKRLLTDTGDKKKFIKEARIMHRLHHKRIVQLIGVCTRPSTEPVFIITELMENGSLRNYLRSSLSETVTFNVMLVMLMEISEGMAFLESKSYIHRDLRAANILVGRDISVKVADFGLAGIIEEVYVYAEDDSKFPVRWVAEEVLLNNKFTQKSDIWSFGILMSEIITYGELPYKELRNNQVIQKIRNGYRMPRSRSLKFDCPDRFYDIMESCWRNHRERPSFTELYNTFKQWVESLDDTCSSASSLSYL